MEYSFIGTIIVLCIIAFYFGRAVSKWQDFGIVEDYKKRGQIALLKPIYIFVALFVGAHILVLFFSLLGEILAIPTNKNVIDVRDLALAFIGSISAIGALFGVYLAILRSEENKRQNDVAEKQSKTAIKQSETAIKQNEIANDQSKIANEQSRAAHRQAKTAEEGLITDRISKATEGLGKSDKNGDPVIVTRLGALYALERIAQDSIRDHISIMEILCAYVHTNSPTNSTPTKVCDDVEVAMKIIGRRGKWLGGGKHIEKERREKYILDLRGCDLNNVLLRGANLRHAWFGGANLNHAWLENTDLSYTWLNRVTLDGARLNNVKTTAAYAQYGDLSGCKSLTQKQLNQMFLGKEVVVPEGLIHPQKDSKYYTNYNTYNNFMKAYNEWLNETGY